MFSQFDLFKKMTAWTVLHNKVDILIVVKNTK